MSLGAIIWNRLTTYAPLVAINAKRVYPLLVPQRLQSGSAIAYQIISTVDTEGNNKLRETRLQVRCRNDTYDSAHSLASLVELALIGYADKDQSPQLLDTELLNKLDDYEEELQRYAVIIDFTLFYSD
ncbi:MAG: hypothetical protein AAF702_32955 [Chloroflexota bacterium]